MEPLLLLSIHQSAVKTVVSFYSSITLCNLNLFSLTFALTSAGNVGMLPHTVMWMQLWVKTQWKLGSEKSVSVSSQYILLFKSESAHTHKINREKQEGCQRVPISHFSFLHDIFIHVMVLLLSPRDNFYIQQKITETIQSTLYINVEYIDIKGKPVLL